MNPTNQDTSVPAPPDRVRALLGKPVAFAVTAAVLLALFGWTFFTNPDRVAPTKDPAFYTWRTEALLSEEPVRLIELEGPEKVFSAGYRVTAPILGGFMRRIADVSPLKTTVILMVILPVLISLLLGAFAYRSHPDPLIFHSVALGAGSLLLTPPFVGYLDNVLTLFFLAAALIFIPATRSSTRARIGFGMFLFLAGMTHPTTLVIFCVVLGAMAIGRLVYRRFDVRSVVRDDGPMLVTAFLATLVVAAVWMIGIWGKSTPLSEAALPPPYEKDFFVDRLVLWVEAMRPLLNGPLFLMGAVGLLAAGRKAAESELTRVSLIWLAPLAGVFGFMAGLTYPYYRFFNTTLAWILLVGVGLYFAARFLLDLSARGGAARLALLGVVALAAIVGTNFTKGFEVSGWNNASGGWLSAEERRDLDVLRAELAAADEEDRPVVFVIDTEDTSPRVYGYTKLSGNTSRYGLPHGQIDQGYLYLGDLNNFLVGQPTEVGAEIYDRFSRSTLEDAQAGIEASGEEPIVVVAQAFNETGSNAQTVTSGRSIPGDLAEVWFVSEGAVENDQGEVTMYTSLGENIAPGPLHVLRILAGFLLLLLPGYLALRWFLPDAGPADLIAMSSALALAGLAVTGLVVLAVVRAPLSSGVAWAGLGLAIATGAFLRSRAVPRATAVS